MEGRDGAWTVRAQLRRQRDQVRAWEPGSARLLDLVGVPPGAHCLDAGCGPGETMRLLAERAGPSGRVHGVDVDEALGWQAVASLHDQGYDTCTFTPLDLEEQDAVPGAPYDVVYARLLLFHVSDRVAVLRRLWDAVAPGGQLVVQDHDLASIESHPPLVSLDEWRRVVLGTLSAAGRDVRLGDHLPALLEETGIGAPDGTDVAGRLEPLERAAAPIAELHRSLVPAAVALGIADQAECEAWQERFARDVAEHPRRTVLGPLLIGVWRRRAAAG